MTIAENMRKGGKAMLKMFKKQMLMPVNLNYCVLLWQMSYAVVIHDGKVDAEIKEGKRRENIT